MKPELVPSTSLTQLLGRYPEMRRNLLMWELRDMPNREIELRIGDFLFNLARVTYDDALGVIVVDVAGGDLCESSNVARDTRQRPDSGTGETR